MATSIARNLLNATLLQRQFKPFRACSSFCSHLPEVKTVQEVKEKLIEYMGVSRGYKPLQTSRAHLQELLPRNRDELPPRKMQDSLTSVTIPLSSDISLQEKYVSFLGQIRLGRLMEDMDIFAVWLAHKHIFNPRLKPGDITPYVIVTVLVDQIDFTDIIPKHDADIRYSGHVSWVGRSSIETTVWLEQFQHGKWQKLTRSVFLLAARDPTNTTSAIVNPLEPENDEEKAIFMGGEGRKLRRIKQQSASLLKAIPDMNEQRIIHDLFLKTVDLNDPTFHKRVLPTRSVWMEDAKLSNIVFSHPEDRNLHNKVFGGFLMRNALELSWIAGYLYTKFRPKLCHISDIEFHKPVDVGSLLRMNSYITYTECNFIQVMVQAEVYDPHGGERITTNLFHFTYEMPEEASKIIPRSYHESMMYLDGRRRFQHVMGLAGSSTSLSGN